MDLHTCNEFALVIDYYHDYKPSILTSSVSMIKIASKYKNNPSKLIRDLTLKYGYPIKEKISLYGLSRLLDKYKIPIEYLRLCPSIDQSLYDDKYDVMRESFNPMKALNDKILIASQLDIESYDNLSRVLHLIPSSDSKYNPFCSNSQVLPLQKILRPEPNTETASKTKELPLLQQIMTIAIEKRESVSNKVVNSIGPLAMLHSCFTEKSRIQVLIRRRKG